MKTNQTHQNYAALGASIRKLFAIILVATFAAGFAALASTDFGPAVWRPSCNANYYTSGYGKRFHVVHDMEGYYASSISMYVSCSYTSAGMHYWVNGKKDATSDAGAGEITQTTAEANYAWHAVCWNRYSSGTEHEGFVSNPAWWTTELYQASALLTRHLADKFGYAKDRNHIVGHGEKTNAGWRSYASSNLGIDPYCNSHTDPGPYWDWNGYMSRINQAAIQTKKFGDFDGDNKADVVLFRPSTGYWYFAGSAGASWSKPSFGYSTDKTVSADYDGDGKMDAAVWRPSNGNWYFSGSTGAYWEKLAYGYATDIPVPGDYDGDGKADVAVWRPSTGYWYFSGSAGANWSKASFGNSTDIPVPADYDGDGKMDAAYWRPSTGYWYFSGSAGANWSKASFGYSTDIPIPGDYDGDGKADVAVFRPSTGFWSFSGSTGANWSKSAFGYSTDIPVPADYDGDGKLDVALWRPSNGNWYFAGSAGAYWEKLAYGYSTDIPVQLPYAVRRVYYP